MNIGIIGAMDMEVEIIKNNIENLTVKSIVSSEFYCGNIGSNNVVLSRCGVGKINAALNAQMMISNFDVDVVINSGIAGAVDSSLSIFDFVVSDSVACHDVNPDIMSRYFPFKWKYLADNNLIESANRAAEIICTKYDNKHHTGLIASGDQFIEDSSVKADIKKRIDPLCVEMEGAAIGQACFINNIPFLVIRCISDGGDDSANFDYDKFAPRAAEISSDLMLKLVDIL